MNMSPIARGILHIALRHESELYLTGNEKLMLRKALGIPTDPPRLQQRSTDDFGHARFYKTDPVTHILLNFHAIIRDKFPDEYAAIQF